MNYPVFSTHTNSGQPIQGPQGPTGPAGPGLNILSMEKLHLEIGMKILEAMGMEPGDKLYVMRAGKKVEVVNLLDLKVVKEVMEK